LPKSLSCREMGKAAIVTTSWDDGHPLDLKLAEMLRKHDTPVTFYIPVDSVERECMSAAQIRQIAGDFDVGGHTYHHHVLPRLSVEEAEAEVVEGKSRLEDIIGREVVSFCYPQGKFNGRVIDIAKKAGFIGARTTRSLARSVGDPFRLSTTVNARNWRTAAYVKHSVEAMDPRLSLFLLRKNLFSAGWERIALETLDFVADNGGVWHLWGHSWEIDEQDDWERLERVLTKLRDMPEHVKRLNSGQVMALCADAGRDRE
jgi:peptidoglycan/xylan/chitin deacetylase (PgdA/CDA1 family)